MKKEWFLLLIFDLFLAAIWIIFANSFKAQNAFDFSGVLVLVMLSFIAFLVAFTISYFLTKSLIKSAILGVLNSAGFYLFFLVVSYFNYKFS